MNILPFFQKAGRPCVSPIIYEGFADGIGALDRTTASPSMVPFGEGRAYQVAGGRWSKPQHIYVDEIHALSVGENPPFPLLRILQESGDRLGTLYMGTAGLLNFSYIAAMRPGAAILFDINPAQTWFCNFALPILAAEKTPENFMEALVDRAPEIRDGVAELFAMTGRTFRPVHDDSADSAIKQIFRLSPLEKWRTQGHKAEYHWMRDAAGYAHLRRMAQGKAIGAITLDVLDKPGWEQLANALRKNDAGAPERVRTMYISNIPNFLTGDKRDFTGRYEKKATRRHMHETISQVFDDRYGVITDEGAAPSQWSHDLQSYCAIPPREPSPA